MLELKLEPYPYIYKKEQDGMLAVIGIFLRVYHNLQVKYSLSVISHISDTRRIDANDGGCKLHY